VKRWAREQKQENSARVTKAGQGDGQNRARGESRDRGADRGENIESSKSLFE
jgi:hypothetical protein